MKDVDQDTMIGLMNDMIIDAAINLFENEKPFSLENNNVDVSHSIEQQLNVASSKPIQLELYIA